MVKGRSGGGPRMGFGRGGKVSECQSVRAEIHVCAESLVGRE